MPFSDVTIWSSLILAIYRKRVRCETINDLANSREFVAQWWSIGARNPVQGFQFFTEDSEFLLCRLSVTRRENFQIYFFFVFQSPGVENSSPMRRGGH